jgi:phenylpropionate dioxygenase-like ring-hydroxylating dioxygenase large terminal subunit
VNDVTPTWQPVLPSRELRACENIVAAISQGEELALWRSADGAVQAWEDRCPHRGTRLSLGQVVDGRLSCAYHGWEFEADGGRCAAIPAHPQMTAPHGVCVKTFEATESQGMIWIRTRGARGREGLAARWG